MALISLSDWLDRFADAPATPASPGDLESIRFSASEALSPPADGRRTTAARTRWRERLHHVYRRVFWRLKRLSGGHA